MYNKDFIKYEKLKQELQSIQNLCPNQYFTTEKCPNPQTGSKCPRDRFHVDRHAYPCIHYFAGNCKYGMNCFFSHHIRRFIPRPEPEKDTCKKIYYENSCPLGGKCKFSHDLKKYPCYYNTLGKCKFSDNQCFYDHKTLLQVPVACFFDLMKGCKNQPEQCQNTHIHENVAKYLSYQGPL